jgi:hypothetical protein
MEKGQIHLHCMEPHWFVTQCNRIWRLLSTVLPYSLLLLLPPHQPGPMIIETRAGRSISTCNRFPNLVWSPGLLAGMIMGELTRTGMKRTKDIVFVAREVCDVWYLLLAICCYRIQLQRPLSRISNATRRETTVLKGNCWRYGSYGMSVCKIMNLSMIRRLGNLQSLNSAVTDAIAASCIRFVTKW